MQQMKMVLFCMIYINQPVLQLYLKMLQNINECVLDSTVWVVWKKCFFRFNFSNSNSFSSQFLASLYMLHFMGGFYAQSHLIVFLLTQRKIQMFFTGWTFLSTGLLFLSLPGPQPQQHLSNIFPTCVCTSFSSPARHSILSSKPAWSHFDPSSDAMLSRGLHSPTCLKQHSLLFYFAISIFTAPIVIWHYIFFVISSGIKLYEKVDFLLCTLILYFWLVVVAIITV